METNEKHVIKKKKEKMLLKVETAKNTNILDSEFKVHGCVRKERILETLIVHFFHYSQNNSSNLHYTLY